METFSLFFSVSGRIGPRPFALVAVAVYVLGFLSQMLISPPATTRWGVWAFALVQAPLAWAWFVLHVKRLRDAGRPIGTVLAIGILYALAIILLMLLIEPIIGLEPNAVGTAAPRLRFVDLWVFLLLFAAFTGQADFGFFHILAFIMVALILLPVAIALGFSIWAGTRPGMGEAQATTP
jgi:uncharacterized membrane protein YhaH (DUF805 family)